MKLTVVERITLINSLPAKGNFLTLKIVRKLTESLSFNEEEHKKLGFREEYICPNCQESVYASVMVKCGKCDVDMGRTGMVSWNPEEEFEKEVHIGDKAKAIIVEALKALDGNKALAEQHMSLYEKFIGEEEETDGSDDSPVGT